MTIKELYLREDKTTVITVCNNHFGSRLTYLSSDKSKQYNLFLGDSVHLLLKEQNNFSIRGTFVDIKKNNSFAYSFGFKIKIRNNCTLWVPFVEHGAVTLVITIHKGIAKIDIGSITKDETLFDYYHSEMGIGDKIDVKICDLNMCSLPITVRHKKKLLLK